MVEYVALGNGLLMVKDERKCFFLEGQSDSPEFWVSLSKRSLSCAAYLFNQVVGKLPTPQLIGVYVYSPSSIGGKSPQLEEVLMPGEKVLQGREEQVSLITSNPFRLSDQEKVIVLSNLALQVEAKKALFEELDRKEEALTAKVKELLDGNPNYRVTKDQWVDVLFNGVVIHQMTIREFAKALNLEV